MPYARPSLTDLLTQGEQDILAKQVVDPTTGDILQALLVQAVILDLVATQCGFAYEHYGYLDWIARQCVPFTAEGEFLEAWAALKAVYRKDATAAGGTFTSTGGAPTSVLPAGTLVNRGDGFTYTTTAAATVASNGTLSVPIAATAKGALGNAAAGVVLTLGTSVTGVIAQGTAGTVLTGGADQELDDDLRTRMLAAYAAPPQGGDREDYVQWAEAVAGVTRAWVAPNGAGAGTVVLYTMLDEAQAANGGFPQGTNGVSSKDAGPGGLPRDTVAIGDQLTVADAIVLKQPVTALLYSCAPIALPTNFVIGGLGTANTAANQAAIAAALTDMFLRLGNVGGTTDPTSGDAWPEIEPSDWYAAISSVAGVGRFFVTSPTAPIALTPGQLPVLGTCTYPTS